MVPHASLLPACGLAPPRLVLQAAIVMMGWVAGGAVILLA